MSKQQNGRLVPLSVGARLRAVDLLLEDLKCDADQLDKELRACADPIYPPTMREFKRALSLVRKSCEAFNELVKVVKEIDLKVGRS